MICQEEPEKPSTAISRRSRVRSEDGSVASAPERSSAGLAGDSGRLRKRLAGDLDTIVLKALHQGAPPALCLGAAARGRPAALSRRSAGAGTARDHRLPRPQVRPPPPGCGLRGRGVLRLQSRLRRRHGASTHPDRTRARPGSPGTGESGTGLGFPGRPLRARGPLSPDARAPERPPAARPGRPASRDRACGPAGNPRRSAGDRRCDLPPARAR